MQIIADNIHIIDPSLAAALSRKDPEPFRNLARRCEEGGAEALDLNAGPLNRDPQEKMTFLVKTVQEATNLPLFLDTANPTALEAGLRACRGKAIINGFSLQSEKISTILPLAKQFDTDIIGYLLYPDSQVPKDAAERLTVAVDLYDRAMRAGLRREQLIIDPVIVPVLWQNGAKQARDVLEVIRTLPELLGFPVRTVAGLSNLTTGGGEPGKKRLLEQSYAAMLAAAGLDMALLNVFHQDTVAMVKACNSLGKTSVFSWAQLP